MKLEGDFLFDAPLEQVWGALLDPEVLAATMPGCEKLDRVDGQYRGELNVKVGPIQGKFSGKVDLRDMDPPRGYTMIVDGQGAPGFVKASAVVKLEHEGEATRMRYSADAQVGGKIASVGQRLLEASARAITKQSLEGLHENIKIRAAAARKAAGGELAPAPQGPAAEEPPGGTSAAQAAVVPPPPAPATTTPAASPPAVVLKRVNQTALATSIAKEVTKSLLPTPVLVGIAAIAIAIVVGWLLLRH
ncbi:MAG TPA: carbon monoxide dehydrogenase subunit G [Polyangiaceae bacterium]|nr:carbon monoxide dehydrogenase subunit G [Polyangiaceae bacterium]